MPLLLTSIYLFRRVQPNIRVFASSINGTVQFTASGDLQERHGHVASSAGAAHLLNNNTGVDRNLM
jgi:hypothetical protein